MKTEFICVNQRHPSQNRFANEMDLLHSCRVEKRKDGKVFLASISGKYFFWINELSDDHWRLLHDKFLLSAELSCSQANDIISRIKQQRENMGNQVVKELIHEVKNYVPEF